MGTIKRGKIRITLGRDTNVFNLANPEDIPPKAKWDLNESYLQKCMIVNENFLRFRGKVNHFSICMEESLNLIFSKTPEIDFLVKKYCGSKFNSFEDISFRMKYNLLKKLIKKDKITINSHNSFLKDLSTLIDERNKFAHGNLVFYGNEAILEYRDNGAKKEELITDQKIIDLESLFAKCQSSVGKVINKINSKKV